MIINNRHLMRHLLYFLILTAASWLSWFLFSRYFGVPVLIVDEAFYIETAKKFLSGDFAYRDNKPPGIFLIYSFIMHVTRHADLSVMHRAAAVAHILGGWLVFFLVRKNQSPFPAVISAVTYLLLPSLSSSPSNFYAANTELFMMAPWLAAWLAFCSSGSRLGGLVLAGAGAGCSMLIKQQGAFLIPAFCFIIAVDKSFYTRYSLIEIMKKYSALAVGFLCVIVPVILVFSLNDSPYSVLYNWLLVNKGIASEQGSFIWALGRIRFRAMHLEPIYISAALAFVTQIIILFRTKIRSSQRINASLLWIVTAIVSYAGLNVGGNYSGHYFIMLFPAVAVLFGLFCSWIFAGVLRIRQAYVRWAMCVTCGLGLGWCLLYPLIQYTGFPPGSKKLVTYIDRAPLGEMIKTTAVYLRAQTTKDDTLFVWGFCPELYYLSGRRPASRYIHCNFLVGDICPYPYGPRPNNIQQRHWDELFTDLNTSMPEYIIDISPSDYLFFGSNEIAKYPEFEAFLKNRYRMEKRMGSFVLYKKKKE
ncbi:MAG: hypothetical protein C4541_13405 [Candidatus Auribacter fodinae]|uniref:Uncharacterized protein n=1 Tax=Candidatus Auribacter fodinae TaxID=2093366 RepID=A0A3A4QV78_9BACT|nr:MAG: hypothetical protein C4541_13405 [Candidatus Auribacter fodinae]